MERDIIQISDHQTDDLIASLFRSAHSLKGAAQALGFQSLGGVAHAMEDLFDGLRNGRIKVTQYLVEALLSGVDLIRGLGQEIAASGNCTTDVGRFVGYLRALAESPDKPSKSAEANHRDQPGAENDPPSLLTEDYERQRWSNQSASAEPATVRIDVRRLDRVMNLVGELLVERADFNLIAAQLKREMVSSEAVERLESLTDHLARTSEEMQYEVLQARLLPLDRVFNRFPRITFELAQKLGKKVELEVRGEETEIDRSVAELIVDPLTQMIRNSVDHGIETPEERARSGKRENGRITLKAWHAGNRVIIEISDDGRGLDTEKLKRSAIKKGFITEDELAQLSDDKANQLIFLPGITTSTIPTSVSGRGVGLDVARYNLQKMGAEIEVKSIEGQGVVFRLKLPLTLAIVRGALVLVDDIQCILPLAFIEAATRVPTTSLENLQGQPLMRYQGSNVPVFWLRNLLGLKNGRSQSDEDDVQIVIVNQDRRRFALAVDSLIGEQEIVLKKLSGLADEVPFISGVTLLECGRVGLVLDLFQIADNIYQYKRG